MSSESAEEVEIRLTGGFPALLELVAPARDELVGVEVERFVGRNPTGEE